MFYRKLVLFFAALTLAASAALVSPTTASNDSTDNKKTTQVSEPLNLAILIQDDLVSQVANEMAATREFIRSLPQGSQVMVGYITTGRLQVRQGFTSDLNKAASSLRVPMSSTAASPYNPYVEVIEALKKFGTNNKGKNAVLLISDGLDTSRGFDSSSAGRTLGLERAIKQANDRSVAVYTFYAPSVGLTSHSGIAASYGQSSLNRLADDTGGRAFFQGTTGFVTFASYFQRLRTTLNEQYARAF